MENGRNDFDRGEVCYRRFLEGDDDAFRVIIDLYRANLIFFINGITHNLSDAEDIAEDCFYELVVHPKRYDFSVSLKTYLYTVARNKSIDCVRYRARRGTVALEDCGELVDAYIGHEKEYCIKERNRALYLAIERLKEEYRTVLYMFYFEDMSYDGIGRIMKKNRKQIDNLLYRARAALRNELGKDGFEYEEYEQ